MLVIKLGNIGWMKDLENIRFLRMMGASIVNYLEGEMLIAMMNFRIEWEE